MSFNLGEKVEITNPSSRFYGYTGTIERYMYKVRLDTESSRLEDNSAVFVEESLKPIE